MTPAINHHYFAPFTPFTAWMSFVDTYQGANRPLGTSHLMATRTLTLCGCAISSYSWHKLAKHQAPPCKRCRQIAKTRGIEVPTP